MEQLFEFVGRHPLLSAGFVAVLGMLIWSEITRRFQGLAELSPAQAVAWMNDEKSVVVDVSAAADYSKGHIVGARNIALSRLIEGDPEVKKLKDAKVLLVCKLGQTSIQAAKNLKKLGFADLAVLKGGMQQWLSDQYPVTKK